MVLLWTRNSFMKPAPFLLLVLLLLKAALTNAPGQTYSWDTIAGLAGPGDSADGTNNTARFYNPGCLTVDAEGVVYVSDIYNNTIRKVQPVGGDWVVTTLAGQVRTSGTADGTNTDALFYRPNGIVVDPSGNLFVVDHSNHTIRKMTPQGTDYVVTTIAGTPLVFGSADGPTGVSAFRSPTGITLDSQGNLYVADTVNFTIRQITPSPDTWTTTTIAGEAGFDGFTDDYNQYAEFEYPYGVAIDTNGIVFVSDYGNNAIRQVTPIGADWLTTTIAGSTNFGGADGLGPVATFSTPNQIAVDLAGVLYVADQGNHTIRKLVADGTNWVVSTIGGLAGNKGSADGIGSAARFNKPFGIAVDARGVLYVADFSNNTIRRGQPVASEPSISLLTINGQLWLSWPASATNYALETSDSLTPTATWQPVTTGITQSGNSFIWQMTPGAGSAFYRLHQK
jgi:streptogramin lyase